MAGNGLNIGDWVTQDLARNPGLSFDVYNSSNPQTNSVLVSHANKGVTAVDAVNDHIVDNNTGGFWSKAGVDIFKGLNFLAKPLQEVQRDYKFIHSVYQKHGFLPGFVATIGTVAGGVAGSLLGPEGTIIGAELASSGMRKLMGNFYKDSYADSENPDYKISAGRDFSNALSIAADKVGFDGVAQQLKETDQGLFKTKGSFVSGITDAIFDVTADPLAVLSRFNTLMKTGKYLKTDGETLTLQAKYPIEKSTPGVVNFLAARSARVFSPNQMDAVRAGGAFNAVSRGYNRALEDIAKISQEAKATRTVVDGKVVTTTASQNAAGAIAIKYPELGGVAAGRLGSLKTADDIHNFFKTSLYFGELSSTLGGQAILPTRTLLREGIKIGEKKLPGIEAAQVALRGDKAATAEENWIRRGYRTFSGYMPFSINPKDLSLSTEKFLWNSPDAVSVIYRIARMGLGHQAGVELAGKYAEAVALGGKEGLALAKSIKAEATYRAYLAMGLHNDHMFVINIKNELDKLDQLQTGREVYGVAPGDKGVNISKYDTPNGPRTGAIDEWQTSQEFSIPNFLAVKSAVREAGQVSKFYGKFDDFISDSYTNRIFKPLALATAGFGLRIAASELIPTFARYGVIRTFKAKLAASRAKLDSEPIKGEEKHLLSAALTSLGIAKGFPKNFAKEGWPTFKEAAARGLDIVAPDEQVELALRLIKNHDGHITAEAVSTGHGSDASSSYQMLNSAHAFYQTQKNSFLYRDLPEYTTYQADSPHFNLRYATNIGKSSKTPMGQNISKDIVDVFKNTKNVVVGADADPVAFAKYQKLRQELVNREYERIMATKRGEYEPYNHSKSIMSRWSEQDPKAFAEDRVDQILGLVVGKDGTFHKSIAEAISKGDKINLDDLVALDRKSVPFEVAGPQVEPYILNKGWLQTAIDIGFKKLIDPIINNLSREPLYLMHVTDEYVSLKYLIKQGKVTEQQALRIAENRAVMAMLPQIHNTALRTQFSQIARNIMPFYFAQEQALKRTFKTLKDTQVGSPAFSRGMRFYQMSEQAMNDPAFVQSDENGNRYIYLPLVGEWGKNIQGMLAHFNVPIVSGLPLTAQGSLVSLKSVLPELQLPGVTPIVSISANAIADWFPETQPVVKGVIGDMSFGRGFWDTINPATWSKTLWNAINLDEQTSAVSNAMIGALSAAYYHQDTIPIPGPTSSEAERTAFIDRIKNNARSILIMKSVLNLLSPLAPKVTQEDPGFRDEFNKLVKQKGNYQDALLEFLGKHGDNAISYTIAKTEPTVIGAKFPYTKQAIDYINNNRDGLLSNSNTSTAAMYLVPQTPGDGTEDTLAIHQELLRQHIRSTRTPLEFMNQFYISAGNNFIAPLREQHNQIVNSAKASQDPYTLKQENDRWSVVMEKMRNMHPIWYADYTNGEGRNNAYLVVNQLQNIFADPKTEPKHEQAVLVKALLGDYLRHVSNLEEYKSYGVQTQMIQLENQNWQNHLDNILNKDARLAPIINSVFKRLD